MILKSKPTNPVKDLLSGVAMLPSTGEFVYSVTPSTYSPTVGDDVVQNVNVPDADETDFVLSVRHLRSRLPQLEWVSLVVSWFGDDLRIGECTIRPKAEYTTGASAPDDWLVAGLERADATVPSTYEGALAYGGTPSDKSVIEGILHLKEQGLKVMFYPFILMDIEEGNGLTDPYGEAEQAPYPWRGRITYNDDGAVDAGVTAAVTAFMGACTVDDFAQNEEAVDYTGPDEWSFRRMILHYANLCEIAGGVDAFCIGTEMRGLTQARSAVNTFPAVTALITLLEEVKEIVGDETEVTYAADWTEVVPYQPQDATGDVLHPLDPLWSHDDCAFVGIDNYVPLSDWRSGVHEDDGYGSIYNTQYLKDNIEGGEGFDFYYASDADRTSNTRTSPISNWHYRFKDHRSWWTEDHFDRIATVWSVTPTAWVPESKRIVYTEYGCAAIDKGTNQPNKFLDPKSSESTAPYFSTEARDDLIQRKYYEAMVTYWTPAEGNNPVSSVTGEYMIDTTMMFAWAWDGRPYPWFPALDTTWADSANYAAGHWLMGRPWIES